MQIDHQQVEALLREAAAREILPLWRNLHDHQVEEKQRNDVVTVADRACEAWLGGRLQALLPGSLGVGEEAAHDDPSIMAALESVRPVWIIDPLDGTNNFAAGQEPIAVMVCLVRQGETLAAWIYDPLGDSLLSAEKGAGTSLDGQTIRLTPHEGPAAGTAPLDLANTYDKVSIFFNFGTDGDTAGDKTYLWDDVEFVGPGAGQGHHRADGGHGEHAHREVQLGELLGDRLGLLDDLAPATAAGIHRISDAFDAGRIADQEQTSVVQLFADHGLGEVGRTAAGHRQPLDRSPGRKPRYSGAAIG